MIRQAVNGRRWAHVKEGLQMSEVSNQPDSTKRDCVDADKIAEAWVDEHESHPYEQRDELAALIRSHTLDAATVRASRDKEWADALGMTEYTLIYEGRTPGSGKKWLEFCEQEQSNAGRADALEEAAKLVLGREYTLSAQQTAEAIRALAPKECSDG